MEQFRGPPSQEGPLSVKQECLDKSHVNSQSQVSSSDSVQVTTQRLPSDVKTEIVDSIQDQPANQVIIGSIASVVEEGVQPPESSDPLKMQVPKAKGKKKKKAPLDPSAPRQPLSGYMRYLNDRRETVRGENPSLSFADITKILAEEWNHLPQDTKQPYLEAGQIDRERYTREFNAYKQTESYRIASQIQLEKKARKVKENIVENGALSDSHEVSAEESKKDSSGSGCDINIFTDEFLDLNRAREAELRQLRNQTTEFEEQNALLEKHNFNLKAALEDIEEKNKLLRMSNKALQDHLDGTRGTLVQGFGQVVLPGWDKPPTVETMFEYMTYLQKYITENTDSKCDQIMAQISAIIEKGEFNA